MVLGKATAGRKYRVIRDEDNIFKPGDIVVALENDYVPLCIKDRYFTTVEEAFTNRAKFLSYVASLHHTELEELEAE